MFVRRKEEKLSLALRYSLTGRFGQASGLSPSLWIACDRSCKLERTVLLPLIVRTVLISTESRDSMEFSKLFTRPGVSPAVG